MALLSLKASGTYVRIAADGYAVAAVSQHLPDPEAYASVFAAAPDMLASLTALTTTLRNCGMTAELMSSVGMYRDEAGNVIHWDMAELVAKADAALAKAEAA